MNFLGLDEVLELHRKGLERHGGMAGVREPGLVESAIASAQNVFLYAGGDEFAVAAAYAFHLAESQSFVDGNKRVAISSAIMFLAKNGWAMAKDKAAQNTLYDSMIAMAKHELDKAGLAKVLRGLCGPVH